MFITLTSILTSAPFDYWVEIEKEEVGHGPIIFSTLAVILIAVGVAAASALFFRKRAAKDKFIHAVTAALTAVAVMCLANFISTSSTDIRKRTDLFLEWSDKLEQQTQELVQQRQEWVAEHVTVDDYEALNFPLEEPAGDASYGISLGEVDGSTVVVQLAYEGGVWRLFHLGSDGEPIIDLVNLRALL